MHQGIRSARDHDRARARARRAVITSNGFSNGTCNYVKGLQTGWKIKNRINLQHVHRRTAVNRN